MTSLGQKGVIHILAIIILLVGLGAGLYLIKNPQILNSKAFSVVKPEILNAYCYNGALSISWKEFSSVKIRAAKNPGDLARPRTVEWWNSRNHEQLGDIILDLTAGEIQEDTSVPNLNHFSYKGVKDGDTYDLWIHGVYPQGSITDPVYIDELIKCGEIPTTTPIATCLYDNKKVQLKIPQNDQVSKYLIRINNLNDEGWNGSCRSTKDDACKTIAANKMPFETDIIPGEDYDWWYHEVDLNGNAGNTSSHYRFTCSPDNQRVNIDTIFTFNSQDPWTDQEINAIKDHLRKIYPAIQQVYGNRYDNRVINIEKGADDELGGSAGNGVITLNVLDGKINYKTLTHELIHEFHGSSIIRISTFEEGMTRATEIQVSRKLSLKTRDFSGTGVYYDFYNKPYIGAINGSIGNLFIFPDKTGISRYELAAYAWTKLFTEDEDFFKKFNQLYYQELKKGRGSLQGNEQELVDLISQVKPSVENIPTHQWYKNQQVFNTKPQTGPFMVISGFLDGNNISLVNRNIYGTEEELGTDVEVHLEYFDASNRKFDEVTFHSIDCKKGQKICNINKVNYSPKFPAGYKGLYKLRAYGQFDGKLLEDVSFGFVGDNIEKIGIHGISTKKNSGVVSVKMPNGRQINQQIINGTFFLDLPESDTYTLNIENTSTQRIITKDQGSYFIILD